MNWEFVSERLWIGTITQERSETVYPTKPLKNNTIGGPGVIVEIDESKFGRKKNITKVGVLMECGCLVE